MAKRREVQALRRAGDRAILKRTRGSLDFRQARDGPLARLAAILFNPAFHLLRALSLAIVWW
jgi:hypothetical protein